MRKRFEVQLSVVIPKELNVYLQDKVAQKKADGIFITKSDLIREALVRYMKESKNE